MKQIQPIQIWVNGNFLTAVKFYLVGTYDNLSTNAIFDYSLLDNLDNKIFNGSLTMGDFDYQAYSTSPDSNNYAYNWGASKLNLTII
jgi:hypothetical protein